MVQLHKFEIKSGGLTARAYYTAEDAGKTTQSSALGTSVALAQPGGIESGWGGAYLANYLGALAGGAANVPAFLGQIVGDVFTGGQSFNNLVGVENSLNAHSFARSQADLNMLMPGTPEFNTAVANATNQPILTFNENNGALGAVIKDVSTVTTFEANYDFKDEIEFANIVIGGIYRNFTLDTDGTLYTDYDAPIEYKEFGMYGQLQKDLFDDNVSLTASLRYDKVEVMEDANITPRLGLLFKLSENKNLRLSAQVGYRNPTNQDKFIGLYNGEEVLLGSTRQNIDRFATNLGGFDWTGNQVFQTAINKSAWDNGSNVVSEILDYVEAEKVTSYDIGYRYNTKDFTIDMNAYWSDYSNFIGTNSVYVPVDVVVGQFEAAGLSNAQATFGAMDAGAFAQFGVDANLDVPFSTHGFSLEAIKKFSSTMTFNFIYEYNKLVYTAEANSNFELSWNTPEHRVKFGFDSKITDNISLGVNARYNTEYYYESSFIDATIDSNTVMDAKLTFNLPIIYSGLKIEVGGNNIGGQEYVSIPGSGNIGSLYYAGVKVGF